MAAFLIIVPSDRAAELDELRGRLPHVRLERVCENVAAFGVSNAFGDAELFAEIKGALRSHDCSLVQVGDYMIGRGSIQQAIQHALG
jgi:hypothetical protein